MKLLISIIFAFILLTASIVPVEKLSGGDQQIFKAEVLKCEAQTAFDWRYESQFVFQHNADLKTIPVEQCIYNEQCKFLVQDQSPGIIQNEVFYEQNLLQAKSFIAYKKEESLYKDQTIKYLTRNYVSLKKYSPPIRAV